MHEIKKNFLEKKQVAHSFNQAASSYDEAAFLQKEVADRLLERLDYIHLNPKWILDLGAGTGYATCQLEKRYKKAKIVSVDLAEKMLLQGKKNKRWFNRKYYVCADGEALPFVSQTFDLIFSSLMLHWCNDIKHFIKEVTRILKPNGLLLLTTLGPDTLYELRESWSSVDSFSHVHQFLDMHFLGDCLYQMQLKDPVVDMEFITITYNDLKGILLDLKDLGTHNLTQNRFKGLTGKDKFKKFSQAYEKFRNTQGYLPVTYEVIYATGWGQVLQQASQTEYTVAIESIKTKK